MKTGEFCLRSRLGNQCLRICVGIYPSVVVTLFLFFHSPRMDFLVLFLLYLALVLLGFVMICVGSKTHYLQGLTSRGAQVTVMLGEHVNTTSLKGLGFSRGASGKESACQCREQKRRGFNPWVRKVPWRRAWQPTPVFLPGKSHRQRSLMGYSSCSHKESDTTERTRTHTHTHTHTKGSPIFHQNKKVMPFLFVRSLVLSFMAVLLYSKASILKTGCFSLDLMPVIGHGCEKCMSGGP